MLALASRERGDGALAICPRLCDDARMKTDDAAGGPGAYEGQAEFMRWLPITLASSSGKLRLADGRLSFTTDLRHKVLFDVPVGEIHSVSRSMNNGLHLWHGPTRYRLAVGNPVYVPGVVSAAGGAVGGTVAGALGSAAAEAAGIPGRGRLDRANRAQADSWFDVLRSRQADPPVGVRVRPPWPNWAWWLGIVGFVLGFAAAVAGIVFASS